MTAASSLGHNEHAEAAPGAGWAPGARDRHRCPAKPRVRSHPA